MIPGKVRHFDVEAVNIATVQANGKSAVVINMNIYFMTIMLSILGVFLNNPIVYTSNLF